MTAKRIALLAAALLAGCASAPKGPLELEEIPLKPVAYVDLDRYMGRWYIIANIPYFAERGNLAPYVEYSRLEDGLVHDLYTARRSFDEPPFTKEGAVEITNPETNAEGFITFLRPLWLPYAVLYVDDDYRYTISAHPSRNYAWIFSREPHMPAAVYSKMLSVLSENLFDVTRVLRIPHRLEEVGLPGYQ